MKNRPLYLLPRRRCLGAVAAFLLLAGCQTARPAVSVAEDPAAAQDRSGWHSVVTDEDNLRLAGVALAWADALSEARRGGHSRRLEAEGSLLDPEAALPRASLPPGSYRCRIIRLGGTNRRRAFTAFEPFFCHVADEGELLSLTKQTGSERPGGYLWDDGRDRMIFLGSVALGNEEVPPAYGEDRSRDMVGILERIGPFHYRMVMPRPRAEASLDVLELIPAIPPELASRVAGGS